MALEHQYTLLCDYAFQDKDGKRHFMGVFTNLVFDQLPGVVSQIYLVASVFGNPGEEVRITIENHERTWEYFVLSGPLPPIEGPGESLSGVVIEGVLTGLELPFSGGYRVVVSSGGERVHAYRFSVKLREPEPKAPDALPGWEVGEVE